MNPTEPIPSTGRDIRWAGWTVILGLLGMTAQLAGSPRPRSLASRLASSDETAELLAPWVDVPWIALLIAAAITARRVPARAGDCFTGSVLASMALALNHVPILPQLTLLFGLLPVARLMRSAPGLSRTVRQPIRPVTNEEDLRRSLRSVAVLALIALPAYLHHAVVHYRGRRHLPDGDPLCVIVDAAWVGLFGLIAVRGLQLPRHRTALAVSTLGVVVVGLWQPAGAALLQLTMVACLPLLWKSARRQLARDHGPVQSPSEPPRAPSPSRH